MKEQTLTEIVEGLKDGSLKVEYRGHSFNERTPDEVAEKLEYYLNQSLESQESFREKGDADMVEFYRRGLERTYGTESKLKDGSPPPIGGYASGPTFHCWGCGSEHKLAFVDETTLSFQRMVDVGRGESGWPKFDRVTDPCEFPYDESLELFEGEIEIPSGKVLVANWFGANKDEEEYYDEIYNPEGLGSINSLHGQYELNRYLLERNVFCAQTGNTSGTVFSNGTEVLMSDDYYTTRDRETILKHYDRETVDRDYDPDDEYGWEIDYRPDGFEEVGRVCMSVWRYMITDYQQALDAGYRISSEHDVVEVQKGRYRVKHMYNRSGEEDITTYFKMKKV